MPSSDDPRYLVMPAPAEPMAFDADFFTHLVTQRMALDNPPLLALIIDCRVATFLTSEFIGWVLRSKQQLQEKWPDCKVVFCDANRRVIAVLTLFGIRELISICPSCQLARLRLPCHRE